MRLALLAAILVVPTLVAGCTTAGDTGAGLSDLGSSIGGGLGRNTDTLGTQRRVDVYGGSTAPSLPTSVGSGFR